MSTEAAMACGVGCLNQRSGGIEFLSLHFAEFLEAASGHHGTDRAHRPDWTGPTGPTEATRPSGANGAIAHVQNEGTALPVEGTLNFTGGGCANDPTNSRTDCTGAGIAGPGIDVNGSVQGKQPTLT
jgi:hypothetical protein